MKSNVVRTRYAPSPTGYFHIGGARTALFNFLFSRSHEGIFIVRIEDTDQERNVEGGIESQLENLKWLKLFFDESLENPGLYGPYIQSEKISTYKQKAKKLLEEGFAYECFCTKEELAQEKEYAIKNKMPPRYSKKCSHLTKEEIAKKKEQKIIPTIRFKIHDEDLFEWEDLIRGKISVSGSSMTDLIIMKADGMPTYNFAVCIDDHDMKISHVLRGEEHISNTPYQIAISKVLKMNESIKYGHLSLIVDENRQKLSKRDNRVKQFIEDYRQMGFTPQAIVNYMALLGWTPKDNVEIKTLNEIIHEFDITSLSSSPSMFDFKKMEWVSREHFKKMNEVNFIDFVSKFLDEKHSEIEGINEILLAFKDQISYAQQLNHLIDDFFKIQKVTYENLINNKIQINDNLQKLLDEIEKEFLVVEDWTLDAIKEILKYIKETVGLDGKNLFLPLRLITTSKSSGIEIAKAIWLLGKDVVMNNIKNFRSLIKNSERK